ncbi:MAG TPA: type II secretion system F family protein [Candidatus Nanoarchaeia archaeon]|nr:type II secretion system F family protein [Candidatus Nanoarchaeia archaeon]
MNIPYAFLPWGILQRGGAHLTWAAEMIQPFFFEMDLILDQANMKVRAREYISVVLFSALASFIMLAAVAGFILFSFHARLWLPISLGSAAALALYFFFQGMFYPKVQTMRRVRDLERNLLPALRTFLIQLSSGVPLFDVLAVVSTENYGEIAAEFRKAVRKINSGASQIEVLEEMAANNPSLFFRRAIWQIANGMKSGAEITTIIQQAISALSQEQVIEIQRYGSQLNPLAMFYMIMVVILPSLGMTFLIMILSFLSASSFLTKLIFFILYGIVVFFQIMFLGIIKTKRPNLLGV